MGPCSPPKDTSYGYHIQEGEGRQPLGKARGLNIIHLLLKEEKKFSLFSHTSSKQSTQKPHYHLHFLQNYATQNPLIRFSFQRPSI